MITTPPVREVKIPVCDVPDKIRKWPSFRIGNEDGHFFNASEDNEPKIIELLMNKRFLCLFWHASEAYDGWIQRDESWEPETIVCERFSRNGEIQRRFQRKTKNCLILLQSLIKVCLGLHLSPRFWVDTAYFLGRLIFSNSKRESTTIWPLVCAFLFVPGWDLDP